MVTKLLPENVTANWDIVKYAIKNSLPPFAVDSPDMLTHILESIISGWLEVWVVYDNTEGISIQAILTTRIVEDSDSKTKNLLLYSVYIFEQATDSTWDEGYQATVEYAKANGCAKLIGYTHNPLIIRRVEQFGGNAFVRFISISV